MRSAQAAALARHAHRRSRRPEHVPRDRKSARRAARLRRIVLRGEAAVTADLVATVRALPFRSDRPFGVRRARREKIAAALFRRDLTFTCHETTEQPVPQHCARALILHETLGRPNWRIPFAGTLRPVLSAPLASRRAGRE